MHVTWSRHGSSAPLEAHGLRTVDAAPVTHGRVISLTPRAEAHIDRVRQHHGYLRVGVVDHDDSGCAELSYTMDFCEERAEDDVVETFGSFAVVVDRDSLAYLEGSEIGYSDDLKHGGLKVTNPNARTSCNCGKSFNVKK